MNGDATESLEAIRRTELEAASKVEEARERSTEIKRDAKAQARELLDAAKSRGLEAAKRRLELAEQEAENDADAIRDRGDAQADSLRRHAEERFDELVGELVELVLPPRRGQGG